MDTRMEKYDADTSSGMSRQSRNADLYQKISKSELNNYEIKSNATILGANDKGNIDVEQIKKILDTRYNETPKRRSIPLEVNQEEEIKPREETTKEYDINAILEKARSEKPVSYEEERVKKLRDTQYDILNNLNLEEDNKDEDPSLGEAKLLDLINTITINEDKNRSNETDNALDILSDLKGDDNTVVFEGAKDAEEPKEDQETAETNTISIVDDKTSETKTLEQTFYTGSTEFTQSDFDSIEDPADDKGSIWLKIVIGFVIVVFLVGLFFFLKSFLNF